MRSLGAVLKEKIKEKGISTHALERQAGLKPSAIQNILYGRSKNPSVNILQAVAQTLGCSITDLLETQENSLGAVNSVTQRGEPEAFLSKKKGPWDQSLYLNCFEEIHDLIVNEKLFISREKIHEIVEEVYNYSVSNDLKNPDRLFAKWMIGRLKDKVS